MSSDEEKINEFLKQMGFSAQLGLMSGAPDVKITTANHMGVNLFVYIDPRSESVTVFVAFAYLPKVHVAPFLRRLLALNEQLIGPAFCIREDDNTVRLKSSRLMEGLDFSEFKAMLDIRRTWPMSSSCHSNLDDFRERSKAHSSRCLSTELFHVYERHSSRD